MPSDEIVDAESLVCWRVTELRKSGIAARIVLEKRDSRFSVYLILPDGTIERPRDICARVADQSPVCEKCGGRKMLCNCELKL